MQEPRRHREVARLVDRQEHAQVTDIRNRHVITFDDTDNDTSCYCVMIYCTSSLLIAAEEIAIKIAGHCMEEG